MHVQDFVWFCLITKRIAIVAGYIQVIEEMKIDQLVV